MAKVDEIRPETIEQMRGVIDFYLLRGILPVARKWPKKPTPPYTPLQAEAMAVFSIANKSMKRLNENILEAWRVGAVGKKASWTDIYRGIIMGYWKEKKVIAPIALNYHIEETELDFQVVWEVLQLYIDPETPEEIYEFKTAIIKKEDILKAPKPIYFTLMDDNNKRLVAPYIELEI